MSVWSFTPKYLLSLTLAMSVSAFAVGQETDEERIEDTVIVTGTKLGLGQSDTATSVSLFDESRIIDDKIINIEDIFDRTANAFTGTTLFGAYSIRGVKNTNVIDGFNSTNALSSLVINGNALGLSATDYLKPSLFDAAQVEILRGPQSVAQGPNTLIGSIVINYNDPSFDGYEGRALAEVGNLGAYRLATMQNVEIIDDILAGRITLETRQADGDVTNTTTGQDNVQRTDEETVRAQFKLRPHASDRLQFDLTYLRNRSDSNPFANVISDPTQGISVFDRLQLSDVQEQYPSEFDFASLEAGWELNENWSLSAVIGYGDFSSDQRLDGDLSPFPLFELGTSVEEEIMSQEVRLNYISNGWTVMVGLFHSDGDYTNSFDLQGVLPDGMGGFIPFNQFQTNEQSVEQTALFAQADIQITDRLATTLGIRFNQETRSFESVTNQVGAVATFANDADFDQVLPSASLRYDVTDALSVGGLYSRGVQGGGFSAALLLGEVRPYDEEFIDNYELFFRYAAPDGRWSANGNVFYFDWQDQQVPFTPENGFAGLDEFIANAGSSSVCGLEVELDIRVTDTLEVFGALGISETEFDEFIIDGQDLSGDAFPGSPNWNAALGFSYNGANGVFASGTYTYVDETYSELGAQDFTAISDRNLLSGKFGYRRDHWSVYVFGENLLDEDYELGLFDRRQIGAAGPLGSVADPLTFGAGIDVNW